MLESILHKAIHLADEQSGVRKRELQETADVYEWGKKRENERDL